MNNKLVFIYDGQCPFCNHFAELLELKSNIPNIQIKDARDHPPEIPKGYDMDINGAILINNNEILSGANAINYICSNISQPSNQLLQILRIIFSSNSRTNLIFPFLIIARRIALFFKGVPSKIIPYS